MTGKAQNLIPAWKRLLSYLIPFPLRHAQSGGSSISLVLHKGRLQLGTDDALYSDGDRYMPALVVRDQFAAHLRQSQQVLILGAGMGSSVQIWSAAGCRATYTLVDLDEEILAWSAEYVHDHTSHRIIPVCQHADTFIRNCAQQFDLIFIDVFIGRHVPSFVGGRQFLQHCARCLTPGGKLALNFIVNELPVWEAMQREFFAVFPGARMVIKGENRLLLT